MADLRTKPTEADVETFLDSVADPAPRQDCRRLRALGDYFVLGFSPRKAARTVYLMDGFEGRQELLSRLGPHRTGKACLYLKRLEDVEPVALRELVAHSVSRTSEHHG